jgi:hypothetical protein
MMHHIKNIPMDLTDVMHETQGKALNLKHSIGRPLQWPSCYFVGGVIGRLLGHG